MRNLKNEKGISRIAIIVIIVIGVIIIFALSGSKGYELSVEKGEAVAYTTVRWSISKSAVDGTGTISKENFALLGNIVKNASSNNQWFSKTSGTFYGRNEDTSDYEITWISDGTYVATFKVENTGTTRYLVEYTFEVANKSGYAFTVTN